MQEHKEYHLKELQLPSNNQNPDSEFYFIENMKKDWGSSPTETYTLKNVRVNKTIFVDNNEIKFIRGQKFNRKPFSTIGLGVSGAVYSVSVQDYLIGITDLGYAVSIGLPKPLLVGQGKTYIVKDEAGGATTTAITIRSAGEETIDGASSATITTDYGSKEFYSDGANWFTK